MLAIAKKRAEENGLQNIIEFKEGDIESLQLPTQRYDAIVCRFGLMFLPRLTDALKTMKEALVPNGRIAAAVWSSIQKNPAFLLPFEIVMKETGTKPPAAGTSGPFSLADTNLLREIFQTAGFQDIPIETGIANLKLPSAEDYLDFLKSTAAPLTAMMAGLSSARQDEIWKKVKDAAASMKYTDSSGKSINFVNEVIYVKAKR